MVQTSTWCSLCVLTWLKKKKKCDDNKNIIQVVDPVTILQHGIDLNIFVNNNIKCNKVSIYKIKTFYS